VKHRPRDNRSVRAIARIHQEPRAACVINLRSSGRNVVADTRARLAFPRYHAEVFHCIPTTRVRIFNSRLQKLRLAGLFAGIIAKAP